MVKRTMKKRVVQRLDWQMKFCFLGLLLRMAINLGCEFWEKFFIAFVGFWVEEIALKLHINLVMESRGRWDGRHART